MKGFIPSEIYGIFIYLMNSGPVPLVLHAFTFRVGPGGLELPPTLPADLRRKNL